VPAGIEVTGPADWVQDAIFYQVFPDRFDNGDRQTDPAGVRPWGARPTRKSFFGGDLAGIRRRLDALQELGITALYLNPIFLAPSNHKYDTTDYLQVDPHLGSVADLQGLVADAHQRGLRVILDGVFSHSGDQFWAFRDAVKRGSASQYRDWYFFEDLPVRKKPPNYRASGGVPFLPRLNTANPAVREYLYGVARHWIAEAGIDGWRLDVPWEQPAEFWRGLRLAVKSLSPEAYLVGEAWGDASPFLQGDQFDGTTHYRLRELLFRFLLQQAIDADTFDRELNALRGSCPPAFRRSMWTLLGSHDTPRLATLAGGRSQAVQALFAFLFTFEGAPLIYYGDEIGLQGGPDPDCRRCMPWDEAAWDRELRALIRRLCQVRTAHVALRRGDFSPLLCQERSYAFTRTAAPDVVAVAVNAGFQPETLRLPLAIPNGVWSDAIDGSRTLADSNGSVRVQLTPAGFVILTLASAE
jgi:glycosidase